MVQEKVTVRSDGVTTERTVETITQDTEPASSGGGAGMIIGILILAALALGIFYLMNINDQASQQNQAVSKAAVKVSDSVEKAAGDVSDAAKKVADETTK